MPERQQPNWPKIAGLTVSVAFVGLLAGWGVLFRPFYVPSEAMLPTLYVGDRFVVGRLWNPQRVQRGDIVTVLVPNNNATYVKRVIGLPGDRVSIKNGAVVLNGVALVHSGPRNTSIPVDKAMPCSDSKYGDYRKQDVSGSEICALPVSRESLPDGRSYDVIDLGYEPFVDNMPEVLIPAGHVFLMGDNRNNSADSRVSAEMGGLGGPVPINRITGKADFVSYSLNGSETALNPFSWFGALRSGRAGTSLRPSDKG